MSNLLLFGGTFDPVHQGHLNVAMNVQQTFHFDQFVFLPCKIPVLKNDAIALPTERLIMLNLAIEDKAKEFNFTIDDREIKRETPSYMVTTLNEYRQELGTEAVINLLIGSDTFADLYRWHQWEKILMLANLLVIKRAGFANQLMLPIMTNYLNLHLNKNLTAIKEQTAGAIYLFDAGVYDISSTHLRRLIKDGKSYAHLLPPAVSHYIKQQQLY